MTKQAQVQEGRDDLPIFIHSELDDYGLSPVEFRVYGRVARRAGGGGQHLEGAAKMAKEFGVSEPTVRRALKLLVLCNLISKEVRPGKTSIYRLLPRRSWAAKGLVPSLRERVLYRSDEQQSQPEPLSPQTGVGLSPQTGVEDGAPVTTDGGALSPQTGVGLSPETDEGTPSEGTPTKEIPHTHTARARATSEAGSADAGVCVKKSRYSFELRKTYAEEKGLGGGWLENSRDGRYDDSEQLLEWLETRRAAQEEGEQPLKPQNLMSFAEAKRHIDSILAISPKTDLEGLISQLKTDDSVKNLLRLRYLPPEEHNTAA